MYYRSLFRRGFSLTLGTDQRETHLVDLALRFTTFGTPVLEPHLRSKIERQEEEEEEEKEEKEEEEQGGEGKGR